MRSWLHYMSLARRWLRNPLVIVTPIVVVLVLAWQQYTDAGRNLNLATPGHNLLAAADLEQASVTEGLLPGWTLSHSGEAAYTPDKVRGHVSGDAMRVTVDSYTSGDVTLATPKVTVKPNERYLFKGYYTATEQFELLVRYSYADGSNRLVQLRSYPANEDTWSMVAHAFEANDRITDVQFVYRLAGTGGLTVDGAYLEPNQQVDVASQPRRGGAIAPASSSTSTLAAGSVSVPTGWAATQSGDNTADFSFLYDTTGVHVGVAVRGHENGEAKWQYAPQPVEPHQYYRFNAAYRSDAPAKLVAEYVRQDDTRQLDTIAELSPAGQWTDITYDMEVPKGAASMAVTLIMQGDGSLDSRGHTLTNITKSGADRWQRPLVSFTFDDGWESAYDNVAPLLDQFGYEGTFYINPLSIETPGFMTAAELRELRETGHEIAAHGYSHEDMTAINPSALDYQLGGGKEYLATAGFPTNHVAPPYGKSDAQVRWLARQYFETLRGHENGINTRQSFDPYNLKVLYVGSNAKTEVVAAALDEAIQSSGWLILVYHYVGADRPMDTLLNVERAALPTDAFAEHLALIRESGVAVRSINAAYTEVSEQ